MLSKSRRRTTDRSTGARSSAGISPLRRRADPHALDSYWTSSMRPLHVLVFLSPLLVAYEIGSAMYLSDPAAGITRSVAAHRLFGDFFQVFGLFGAALPGVALVTVLIFWHIFVRDKWRVDGQTLAGMFIESIAWTLPLLVLAASINHARTSLGVAGANIDGLNLLLAAQQPAGNGGEISQLPIMARATISVGAGLYEEMLFRLVGLAILHFVLADLIGLSHRWAYAVAIVISALAFAVYHDVSLPRDWALFLFMTIAGIYFGTVYVMRGFGIVVMAHAVYDVLVLVVFPGLAGHK